MDTRTIGPMLSFTWISARLISSYTSRKTVRLLFFWNEWYGI